MFKEKKMFDGYKIVAVVPAGRKKYLELLLAYLKDHKNIIDSCRLWMNTKVQSDIDYITKMTVFDPFFVIEKPKFVAFNIIDSIHQFFKNCVDENTIYIRFDDDVCYIAPDAIVNLLKYRITNPQYFTVYPYIVNNSMNVCFDNPYLKYKKWYKNKQTIIKKHNHFLENCHNLDSFKINDHVNVNYHRYNINCICWFGKEFAKFNGSVKNEEEQWLAVDKPKSINSHVAVCGSSLICHYSFRSQNEYLEKTDIFERYKRLKIKMPKML